VAGVTSDHSILCPTLALFFFLISVPAVPLFVYFSFLPLSPWRTFLRNPFQLSFNWDIIKSH